MLCLSERLVDVNGVLTLGIGVHRVKEMKCAGAKGYYTCDDSNEKVQKRPRN